MNEKLCKTCHYFRQHYTFDSRKIFCVLCGHCMYRRIKHRKPDTQACDNYVPAPAQEDAFASKEYLSKELIQYMKSLDLLPAIENAEQ